MISRSQIAELQKTDKWLKGWTPVNDSDTAPICYGDYKDLLDTLEALWKVAEAANKAVGSHVCWTYGCPSDGLDKSLPCDHNEKRDVRSLMEALAALEEK